MGLLQLGKGFQLTLPAAIRRKLGLKEGDFVTAEVEGEAIVLRPKRLIRKGQEWFWTDAWQEAEREAEEDLRSGRVHKFKSADDAIKFLHQRASQLH
ncbi:MAG: AbrB/MazE/SpoVT family DNA-binding domain-containing protein [Chloroflexi bacterium]|nr:AbrB/MazE/SpoVT family DNA-binding domain-containing protein [Chloroflexota bacterium]MBI3740162.1 AbrB/MazE/SpoVT family DNA-binding domain-containing protein [Chloroflexota bacterium]